MWSFQGRDLILCPHDANTRMRPVAPEVLRLSANRTYEYLATHKDVLDERRGFAGWEKQHLAHGFYAIQRIGEYTFSPYKVVWRYIAPIFTTAVLGPESIAGGPPKPVLPHEKLMLIPCETADEAYYLCGLLSAAPAVFYVESRMVSTQIAPHVVGGLHLPAFDRDNECHAGISRACRDGHDARRSDPSSDIDEQLRTVDEGAAAVYGLTEKTLSVFQSTVRPRGLTDPAT